MKNDDKETNMKHLTQEIIGWQIGSKPNSGLALHIHLLMGTPVQYETSQNVLITMSVHSTKHAEY